MKYNLRKLLGFLTVCVCSMQLHAQDTLRLSIEDAEKQFLRTNLRLLIEKYNINAARAQVIQAGLYANPNLQFTGNLYNPQLKKYFDVSNQTGEYIVTVQQLILLAGKRNKQVRLAETNTAQSENAFYDLLRTLRYSLRSNFYSAYFLQRSVNAYSTQISSLQNLNAVYDTLQSRGVVTLKDAVRIKALLYSLKAEQATIQNQLNDVQAELQLLLSNNKLYINPQVTDLPPFAAVGQLNLQTLIDSAYVNRFDIKMAENTVVASQQNYALQKALRVPDLTLGATYDKRGSFVESASFLNAAIDLPFFNRNQGNIKLAKNSIEQSKVSLSLQQQTVENEVQAAYVKALNTNKLLQSVDPSFGAQFEKLLEGITENFRKKNISLIEFTDFNESYKNNIIQLNQLQNDRMQAIEALNFAVGKSLINQ